MKKYEKYHQLIGEMTSQEAILSNVQLFANALTHLLASNHCSFTFIFMRCQEYMQ